MKKTIYNGQVILYVVILLITSCDDSFLDVVPKTEYSDELVWSDPALIQTFLNNMYRNMHDPLAQRPTAVFTDEAHRSGHADSKYYNASLMTADRLPGWDHDRGRYLIRWQPLYEQVRRANVFFQNIDKADFKEQEDLKEIMIGEVYFLRAYAYFFLARQWGGVPILEEPLGLGDNFEIPRNTFEEVIEFIVNDLDKASEILPIYGFGDDLCRPSKGAALALKSRVLLTAASDLFNTIVFPDYPHPELIGYTDKSEASRRLRWQRARDAAKDVMDLNAYTFYQGANDSATLNFVAYHTSVISRGEDIMNRYMNYIGGYFNNYAYWSVGQSWGGQQNIFGIGNWVDAVEMRDGTKFDWNNPVHAASPYINRDPRFYAFMRYEGAYFRERPQELRSFDPLGRMQEGIYEVWDESTNTVKLEYGLDYNARGTGYRARKYLDPSYEHGIEFQPVTFRYFRFTEILFNYAEACIELEEYDLARQYLNMIRRRADMPDITDSGDDLRKRFRNEKKIEMFLEDQRYFDIRRWVIAHIHHTPTEVVDVRYKLLPDKTTSTIPLITPRQKTESPKRAWLNKAYFLPIKNYEIYRNPALIQNPGY